MSGKLSGDILDRIFSTICERRVFEFLRRSSNCALEIEVEKLMAQSVADISLRSLGHFVSAYKN